MDRLENPGVQPGESFADMCDKIGSSLTELPVWVGYYAEYIVQIRVRKLDRFDRMALAAARDQTGDDNR